MLCFLMSIIGSAWGQESYTIVFNNSKTQSSEGYFTLSEKQNLKSGSSCTYDNVSYEKGLKMEDGTSISFTNAKKCNVTIVQWYTYDRTIKFDGTEIALDAATETNKDNDYRKYVIEGVETGTHTISRGNGESTIFLVEVNYIPVTQKTSDFIISDFNYATNRNANSGLNRSLCGFTFEYSGGDALKCNATDKLTFRTRNTTQNGSVAISTTNGAKIFSASFTFDKDMTDYYTAKDGDGNDLASSVSGNVVTVTSADGVSKIVFSKKNVAGDATDGGKAFDLSKISLTTDTEMPTGKVTPNLVFASSEITTTVGESIENTLTTTPGNFNVSYISDNESVVTVDALGKITPVAAGTATITASSIATEYFNAANTSYTITVYENESIFNVSGFNYAGQSSSREQSLDRAIGGFSFTYTGGEAIKYNADNNFFFRENNAGTLTIAPTDANNKITKIVIGSTTDVSAVTGFTVTADGNTIEPVLANGSITIDVPAGASSVVISTNELSASVNISSYTISTTAQPSKEPYQPVFAFEHASLTVAKTGDVANALTTTPKNYPVTFSSFDTNVATVNAQTGAVTPVAAGTTTITVSSTATNYFNAANASYTLTVVDDESVSFEKNEVVFAVNTNKAYTAATGDDGKVTYTALEGNVNAATSSASNAMTYTSSDENLIKVNAETGELTLGDNWTAGKTVTVTATSAAGQTATYTVKLKFETSISFGDANGNSNAEAVELMYAHLNVGFVEPKATIVPAGVNLVTYSSNNPSVATVIENTGEVTFPASEKGYATITATIPDNEYYMGSSAQYQIVVGDNVNAGEQSLTDYQIVSYQDSKYTANTGHKFTVANATAAKKIISGEQFTNVPGIELTFGAYTGLGNVNNGDLANLGTIWTLGEDKYLAHENAATYDEETNLPIGGYMAFEPVVSGILTMDLTWYKGQTFVLVDKSTNAIVESYTAGSEYAGEHRFSTPLQAGRTYYLYNKGGKVDGVEVNGVMKFRSASFTPVFLDKVTSIIPSKLTDGKVMFDIKGADYYNGSSVIPSLSTARHDHDDIAYTLSDGTYLNMTADGVFEILEAMEGNNNAVTVTITANIEAKTPAPNDDADGDSDHMHSSVAVCQVTYTKSDIKFAKESIDVTLFAENKGADIVEPALTYTKDDVAYASSNTNAFAVDANTGNLTVGTNPSGETTITATVNNDDILRYYTNNSAQYKINCKNYSHVKINQTEVEMTVGETGVNILRRGFIEVVHEHPDKIYRLNENGTFNGDKGERKVYKTTVVDQFVNNGVNGGLNTFFFDATKTNTGKNNGSANTNILYVNKEFTMDAKAAGTTTVYVNLEKLAYSENGQEENPTIKESFDAVTIPIKVTIKPREFNAENATLRVWDFTKEIDAATLQTFANSNSTYWTYNKSDNTVKTSVIKPTEDEDAKYYKEYDGDKAKFLEGKKAFENHEFDLSVFNETLEQEDNKDVLRLSTLNNSNYEKYLGLDEEQKEMHKHTLNVVSDITLNKESTIKDNNYMPPVDGSNTNLGENSDDVCYRGINLEGKASFLHVPNVDDNISIMMIADHNSTETGDYLGFASSGSNQAGLIVGPYKMTDGTYDAGYNYNRLTNVINYAPRTDENGIVTEVAVEPADGSVNVVSVVAGYIATSGILNKGEGKAPTSAETRTDGYTTVVSPYNIDMTGQKVVKAYICDYYGKDNNKVHMKQIKHIPANTPVMLRGYARDLYALFISEGNKAVDPGIDESFIKNNRLRGNATEDIYVPLEETEVNSDGEVVKYYNYGLSGSKWVKFGTDGTMKAGKAYLRLTEKEWADLQEAMISSAGVSATRLSFEFEDLDASDDNVSTGIVQVGIQKDVAGDGYYYSINGIRIGKEKPASKGVYIYNGKKIVVR